MFFCQQELHQIHQAPVMKKEKEEKRRRDGREDKVFKDKPKAYAVQNMLEINIQNTHNT